MVFETEDELVLVDAGFLFPGPDLPGVDVIVPDFEYLKARRHKLKALFLTHGHEDHIGAVPHLLRDFDIPVYGTRFTLGLLQHRLEEAGIRADLREVHPRDPVVVSKQFTLEPIRMAHSMPDAVGFALRTPEGTLVHTGDFKIDETPIDGHPTDLPRLAELGDEGVLCLLSDSTNAEVRGETPSEKVVADCFDRLFAQAPGRIIVTMFASHLLRVQHVLELCARTGRRVGIIGRSMVRNIEIAAKLGTLQIPAGLLIAPEDTAGLPPEKVCLLATGAQAEPRAALSQLLDDNRGLRIRRGDMVLFSARAIPGNERPVTALIDALMMGGANVRYSAIEPDIHVSGHASSAQQRRVLEHVRPKSFVPIHGELHHLACHADIARATGVRESGVLMIRDGDVLGLSANENGRVLGQVPVGRRFTSREGRNDVGLPQIEDRVLLSQTGVIAAALVVDSGSRRFLQGPILSGRGLAPAEEAELGRVATSALAMLEAVSTSLRGDQTFLREELGRAVRRAFKQHLGRKPMVVPIVIRL